MKQFKVGVCAGHNWRDPGAIRQHVAEQPTCRGIVDYLKEQCAIQYDREQDFPLLITDPMSDLLSESSMNDRITAYNDMDLDLVVDIHLDTCQGKHKSRALLMCRDDDARALELAEAIKPGLGNCVGSYYRVWTHNPIVVTEKKMGRSDLSFLHRTKAPAIIVEMAALDYFAIGGELHSQGRADVVTELGTRLFTGLTICAVTHGKVIG